MQLETLPTGNKELSVDERMLLIRLLEDRLQELCNAGLGADLHFSRGQEAICTGVCHELRPTDYMVTHHRTIAHAVAKGVPLEQLVAEILGKASGINGGLAGEMHISCPAAHFMFSFQLVGTCIPVAAGLAWAVKNHTKTDDIVVVFHGDAATANAQWHEGVNLAAVHKLPLLLVCENNRLAGNVGPQYYLPIPQVMERAAAYGIEAAYTDGNNVQQVMEMAKYAIDYVRTNSRPFLLECETTRLGKHKQGQGDLRTKEEIATLALRDPLRTISVEREVITYLRYQVETAIRAALSAPDPVFPKEQ